MARFNKKTIKRKVLKYTLDISKLPVSLFNINMNYNTFNVLLTYS